MPRRLAALFALAAALGAAAGCGSGNPPRVDQACLDSPDAIERAPALAPQPAQLASAARLSDCVSLAQTGRALQMAAFVPTRAECYGAARARQGAASPALDLGYL